jgi:tetratricopeptide (TPR) repeat protein
MEIRKRFMAVLALSFWATLSVCAEAQDARDATNGQRSEADAKAESIPKAKISREEALKIADEVERAEGYLTGIVHLRTGHAVEKEFMDELLRHGIDASTAWSVMWEIAFDRELAATRVEAGKLADETAQSLGGDDSPARREEIANALLTRGIAARKVMRPASAFGFFDEIVLRFGEDKHPKIRLVVVQALNHKGLVMADRVKSSETRAHSMAQALAAFDEVDRRFSKDKDPAIQAEVMGVLSDKAYWLGYWKEIPKAIAVYDEIVRRRGAGQPGKVAAALLNKAQLLDEQGSVRAAITIYDEIIRSFGQGSPVIDWNPYAVVQDFHVLSPFSSVIQNIVFEAQLDKADILHRLGDTQSEIAIYDQMIQRLDDEIRAASNNTEVYAPERKAVDILSRKIKTLDGQKNAEAVLAGFDEMIRRSEKLIPVDRQSSENAENIIWQEGFKLRGLERVGLYFPGNNRLRLAIAQKLLHATKSLDYPKIFNIMESLLAREKDPATRTGIAMLFLKKAFELTANQYSDDDEKAAIAHYDAVVRFFGEDSAPATRYVVAQALNRKGRHFFRQDEIDARIAVYDEVDRRFGQGPYAREEVANALFHKGEALDELGDAKGAIATLEDIDRRFGKEADADVREKVAKALLRKGEILQRQGDNKAAIAIYDEIDQRFQTDFNDATRYIRGRMIQKWGAKALLNKGVILGSQGNHKAEIALYDEIERRFASLEKYFRTEELDEVIIEMFSNKGAILKQQGNYRQAIAAYDEIDQRFKDKSSVSILGKIAEALVEKGIIQYQQGNIVKAIATYDEIMRRFDVTFRIYPNTRKPLAKALYFKGVALEKQGELQAAIVLYEKVANDFGNEKKEMCRESFRTDYAACISRIDAIQLLVQQAIQARDAARKRLPP